MSDLDSRFRGKDEVGVKRAFCGPIKLIAKVYFTMGEAWPSKGLVRMAREKR